MNNEMDSKMLNIDLKLVALMFLVREVPSSHFYPQTGCREVGS